MPEMDFTDYERRMQGAVDALHKEFQGLRTGRASTNLLDNIHVEVYGSKMPINQVATVSAPEPRLLTVQVWDAGNTKAVEKAISTAGLGLNPQPAGTLIRVPLPGLTEERRVELAKVASKYAEQAKIAVRNIRREGMDTAKKNKLPEDELKKAEDKIQKMTDGWIKKVEEALAHKEQEIKQV
ncbi:MAG: ribosome recycling factor [Alphaproteobacteria bacterium]|nr:ribosome recycling factor [Alphaproteobacteria bacterium]MDE2336232.1 ribosome recycling factor [Alphaproteobacteria bacterium]